MKIKDINYYVKFIFSSLDGKNCLSTTDKDVLNCIKSAKTDQIMSDYSVGDLIYMDSDKELKFKVTDILINRLVDDTNSLKIGLDSSDCENTGDYKEALFNIHIIIEKI